MEIYGKIYKNWSAKNKSFFVKKDFSLEAVSPVKNSDRTVNNTHTVVSLQFRIIDIKDVIDSDLSEVHSATPIIHCVKTSLQTEGTRPSVGANYLADDIFWREEILFLRRELENKQKTINKL